MPERMRITLFDWTPGGHHLRYVQRFAAALSPVAEVVAAVPDVFVPELEGHPVEVHPLGAPRPALDMTRPLPPQHADLAERELDVLAGVAAQTRGDHLVHLYADPVLRRLVRRPPLPVPTTLAVFFARAHYPSSYGSRLDARERARAVFLELLVARWRRRPDAHAILSLDEAVVRTWSRRRGAPAHWLPEPPLGELPQPAAPEERRGAVLYGALAPRKGIDRLAAAVAAAPGFPQVVLAGGVEAGYEAELAEHAATMRAAGARVDVRSHRHGEQEGLATIGAGRCVVLPYPLHFGMSRVLVEAAAMGTPVVAHDFGLIGHLVREHGLGLAVDCAEPGALRRALDELAGDPDAPARHAPALAAFAARFSPGAFAATVRAPFGSTPAAVVAV